MTRYGLRRGVFTLAGLAGAATCIWLASLFDRHTTAGYWYAMGLLIGAGVAVVLSQLLGGWTKDGFPHVSPSVFVLGFLPALVVFGWVLVAGQPHGNTARAHMRGWASEIHANGLLNDWRQFLPAFAVLLGLAFALCFDTRGRRRERVVETHTVEPAVADAPLARERIASGATTRPPAIDSDGAPVTDPDGAAVTAVQPGRVPAGRPERLVP